MAPSWRERVTTFYRQQLQQKTLNTYYICPVKRKDGSQVWLGQNVRLVMEVSDRITVLNFGKVIAHGEPKQVASHPEVIAAYLGSDA